MGRGLNKLISDACVFADSSDLRQFREQAFDASASRLLKGPQAKAEEHRQSLALELAHELGDDNDDPFNLYGDLPQRARLDKRTGLASQRTDRALQHALGPGLTAQRQRRQSRHRRRR